MSVPGNATPTVRVLPTRIDLDLAAAREIALRLHEAIERRGHATFALAGGETPLGAYRQLVGSPLSLAVSWGQVEFLQTDERLVPLDSPASNGGRARATLIDPLRVPEARIHLVPLGGTPSEIARRYARDLEALLGADPIDLVLLGMGADGHTASLFPESPALEEREAAVLAVEGPPPHRARVSLTLPRLGHARRVLFLVAGAAKAEALAAVLAPGSRLPAARVRAEEEVLWLVDAEAAALLEGAA